MAQKIAMSVVTEQDLDTANQDETTDTEQNPITAPVKQRKNIRTQGRISK